MHYGERGSVPTTYRPSAFEVGVKGREIREILAEYVRELDERKWVDRAGVMQLAIQRLTSNDGRLPGNVLVLVPEDVDILGLERRLLDALPATANLVSGRPAGAQANERRRLIDRRSPPPLANFAR